MIYIHEDEWEQFGNIYTKEKRVKYLQIKHLTLFLVPRPDTVPRNKVNLKEIK